MTNATTTTTPPTLSNKAQRLTIDKELRQKGRMTTLDARELGIKHPAARVMELRRQGMNIVTNIERQTDSVGVAHQVAVYSLDGSL